MMKATDLMIGDWIFYKNFNGNLIPHKIIGIKETYAEFKNPPYNMYQYDRIYPIPLTPEILEKNFGKPYPRGGFHNYRMEKDETIAFVIEDRRVSAAPDNRVVLSRCPGTYICDVNYVHQLQHALRLCGINKEITL